jgi:cytochrome c553
MTRPLLFIFLGSMLVCTVGCDVLAKKPAADTAAAEDTAYYFCGGCHAPPPVDHMHTMAPKIEGQKKGYLVFALKSYRDKTRHHPFMNGMAKTLTDSDIENLALYYAGAKPKP